MSFTKNCPRGTTMTSAHTDATSCKSYIGQIQKMIFWRTGNSLGAVASALTSTTMNTYLAATGDTKMAITPFCAGVTFEPGDKREFGSGNEVLHGVPIVKGSNPTVVTGRVYAEDQDVVTNMKTWESEEMDVIFINENGSYIYSDTNTFGGFRVRSFHVKDLMPAGFEPGDHNEFSFFLEPNWSNSLEISSATSFALDLVNS